MNWAQHILIFGVRVHQRVLSPVLVALLGSASQCRFEPSCSRYAAEAVQIHGAIKGSALAAWRICRCQPWGKCGHDHVPPAKAAAHFKFQINAGPATQLCQIGQSAENISGRRS